AILLAQRVGGENVLVIEGNDRILKKLALTGNGQCNITNTNLDPSNYFGDTDFIRDAFERFDTAKTLELFEKLGIETVTEEDGRVYPRSYQASSCADIFRLTCENLGIEIRLSELVTSITKCGDIFEVKTNSRDYSTSHVIYSLGGATYPKLLTNASNFKLLSGFSHTIKPLLPSLVQLKAKSPTLKMLKGIKTDVGMSLIVLNKVVDKTFGEAHFADNALSGPATFTLSPKAALLLNDNVSVDASIDFFHEYDSGELLEMFCNRAENLGNFPIDNFFSTLVHNQIGRVIIKECNLNPQDKISTLTDADLIKIMQTAKNYRVKITETNGVNFAQVSLGGVPTSELTANLESKLVEHLYITGEACDVTGVCGGYNLQWAWTSAQIVASTIDF
ncbi:MAG: aminoacetone oxidase family FAD-binding enzyme, partial [Clostridia bacterium]